MAGSDQVAATQRTSPETGALVLTVGHSTREQEDFIALLKAHGVKVLMDVRAIPPCASACRDSLPAHAGPGGTPSREAKLPLVKFSNLPLTK
jgi:hypothetical protein